VLRCTTLHFTAPRCAALPSLRYIALPYTALHYIALPWTALHYYTLHYFALHCTGGVHWLDPWLGPARPRARLAARSTAPPRLPSPGAGTAPARLDGFRAPWPRQGFRLRQASHLNCTRLPPLEAGAELAEPLLVFEFARA